MTRYSKPRSAVRSAVRSAGRPVTGVGVSLEALAKALIEDQATLWLDPSTLDLADGANVSSLPDLSGNSRDATPVSTAPTLAQSGPNGQQWILSNARPLATPSFSPWPSKRATWFVVYSPSTDHANWNRVFGTNTGGSGSTFAWGNASSEPNGYNLFFSAFSTITRLQWERAGESVVMCLRQDGDTSISAFRNATKVQAYTVSDVAMTSNPVKFGESLTGHVGEAIMFPSELTDQECFLVGTYLSEKWATSGAKPINVVFEGDSQTYGAGLGADTHKRNVEDSTWPHKLITELNAGSRVSYQNLAIGGSRWDEVIARASACDERINPYATNVLFAWAGTNDAYRDDATATHAQQKSYCEARRAAGWDFIIVGTAMDRADSDPPGWRSSFNTLVRNNYADYADGLIDVGGHAILGAESAYLDTTYFNADQVHLNATGWQIVAEMAADELTPLVGL